MLFLASKRVFQHRLPQLVTAELLGRNFPVPFSGSFEPFLFLQTTWDFNVLKNGGQATGRYGNSERRPQLPGVGVAITP